jgi:hypothetical protein
MRQPESNLSMGINMFSPKEEDLNSTKLAKKIDKTAIIKKFIKILDFDN